MSRLLVAVLLVTGVAACRPSVEEPATSTTSPPTTTTTLPALTPAEALSEFTACVRGRGVDIPDIPLGADGRPRFEQLVGQVDLTSDAFLQALGACAEVLRRSDALDLGADPALAAATRLRLEAFAVCMRAEGVSDFPDPRPDAPTFPPWSAPQGDPDYVVALRTCAQALAPR